MRAAYRDRYVPLQDLRIAEVEVPVPKSGEILVRVCATTINRTDCAVATGKPAIMRLFLGLLRPRNPVLGTDFAGIVEEVGPSVSTFSVGDYVWGFNDEGIQSQAEYMVVSCNEAVSPMPKDVGFAESVCGLEAAHYAYNFMTKVDPQPGQRALINGASGGIGSALLQFLKHTGLTVTAVCNTKNIALIKQLGADRVYDYEREDFTHDEQKYDFVLDSVGKSTFGKCKHLLTDQGVYISSELGPYMQNPLLAIVSRFRSGKRVVFPIPVKIRRSMDFVKQLMEEKHFAPVIDREYSMDDLVVAYQYVASGQKTGNVVLRIHDS